MENIDAVIGVRSTVLYEGVMLEKPVGILPTSYDGSEGMIENELAELLSVDEEDFLPSLKTLVKLSKKELKGRKEKLSGKEPLDITVLLQTISKRYRLK